MGEEDSKWERSFKAILLDIIFSKSGQCHQIQGRASRCLCHRYHVPAMLITLKSEITRHLEMKACCNIGPRQDGHILEKAMLPSHCKSHHFLSWSQQSHVVTWTNHFTRKRSENDPNNVNIFPCGSRRSPEAPQRSLWAVPEILSIFHQKMANCCSHSIICFDIFSGWEPLIFLQYHIIDDMRITFYSL